jgi:hypothetical protein
MMRAILVLWAMILLHDLHGAEAWFRADEIMHVSAADPVRWGPKARTVILLHDTWLAVTETPAEVILKIEDK